MPYSTADIRNVCLVGPSHAGKTLLTEALLHAGGKIPEKGSIERGTTVSDFTDREKEIGHSQYNSVCHLDHEGIHVNLIDTPGYRDFYGRALSVMPATETAAVVINATEGVEEMARRMMRAAHEQRKCRMIIVNQIDAEGVDFEKVFNEIQEAFGKECLPMNLPTADGSKVVDCFFQLEGDETAFSSVGEAHTQIVDQVVEVDEALMEIYLEQGEELEPEQLHDPFEKALREEHLVPVCFVSAQTGIGIRQLLQIFERLMPNPTEANPPIFLKGEGADAKEVSVNPDPNAHAIAHVFMVNVDPFKGRLALFRIHQGTINAGNQLYVGDARKPFKASQLLKVNGEKHDRKETAVPGDICAVPRVEEAHYDAVLHDSHDEDHFHLKPIKLPRPMFGLAIRPREDKEAQKVSDALHTAEAEDPSIQVEHIVSLNEVVLRGLGELHLATILQQMKDRSDIEVITQLPSIAYRETITANAEGHHRHKKQTGGAGQFGEVYLRVEPLPQGEGFEFGSKVVGGAIPSQFISAVENGVKLAMVEGAINGYPMQDIRVTVYDGKHHSVDSKEIAFVQAGKKAFLEAVAKARPIVMEPIVNAEFTIPPDAVGGVTGDLSGMRGMITGTDALPDGRALVTGQVPLQELQGYHSRLKSLTGGEGNFTMDFSHYAEVPALQLKELKEATAESA
ncbi:MAG: elongation factor G [Gammaproteobacteria bacterium]|nr:elongation factor G [Gammaproteobacteria bacterium]NNF50006.1 elongation factor G [Woeseiaceae bacterium]MBT8093424.1 elongation factor G [Gammaproteobacteria bacterium]MBT8104852.1 elongation factor G [Gammaproteobacteria bacterium]NNK24866.1 elongation factor G [Woeseiaceae bacterium]